MQNTTIYHVLNFLVAFQQNVTGAARIHYGDLRRILDGVLDRQQIEMAVQLFFDKLSSGDTAVSSALNKQSNTIRLAGELAGILTPKEKLLLLLFMVRSVPELPLKENSDHTLFLLQVARAMQIPDSDTSALLNLVRNNEPAKPFYKRSVCVTGELPDYNNVIDGFRVVYRAGIPVAAWLMKFDSCDVTLVRIVHNNSTFKNYSVRANDILPLNDLLTEFLTLNKIDVGRLLNELHSPHKEIPFVHIPATETTPEVILDPVNFRIEVAGHSVCVTPRIYFDPILKWIECLKSAAPQRIQVHIHLDYFNTYSSKIILEIFFRVRKYAIMGWSVTFFWYYAPDDDDLRETGENYAEILACDFRVVERAKTEIFQSL
jgi:hypothetical protein